jgi:pimeloyl-ACP methyl ester carboxylesterase
MTDQELCDLSISQAADLLSPVELATVLGAGRLVMGDNPEGFEQAVTGFLNSFV